MVLALIRNEFEHTNLFWGNFIFNVW